MRSQHRPAASADDLRRQATRARIFAANLSPNDPAAASLEAFAKALMHTIPPRIGPCELVPFAKLVALRCPRDLAPLAKQAGGQREPGSRRWLIETRRLGPLSTRSGRLPTHCSGPPGSISIRAGYCQCLTTTFPADASLRCSGR